MPLKQGGKGRKKIETETFNRSSRPGRKTATNKQIAEIIDFVAILLGQQTPKAHIKRRVNEVYFQGDEVSARTIEDYISRGKALMVELSGKPKDDHRKDVIQFLQATIASPDTQLKLKLEATKQLREILALDDAPTTRLLMGGDPDGVPIQTVEGVKVESVVGMRHSLNGTNGHSNGTHS